MKCKLTKSIVSFFVFKIDPHLKKSFAFQTKDSEIYISTQIALISNEIRSQLIASQIHFCGIYRISLDWIKFSFENVLQKRAE